MKKSKNILKLLVLVLIVVVVGYFVHSCSRLSDKQINREYFMSKGYMSIDLDFELVFFNDGSAELRVPSSNFKIGNGNYVENIFEFTYKSGEVDTKHYFIVIDKDILYYENERCYLYLVTE